jgi:glycosyltransferase involved in cell wall biosynthesis
MQSLPLRRLTIAQICFFVGALDDDDSPNVDSLVWFVRTIMPLLDRMLGASYCLKVVGRDGSRLAKELANARVRFFGVVDDLSEFYSKSRIFVAPTRYAAGLPMKVHEAAAAGLPVVATSLLANQLTWRDGSELLAAFCVRLFLLVLRSEDLVDIAANALKRIREDCSPSTFSARIASVLAASLPR